MKKRMRAMRRWGERLARWGLTLLLVALVGVTVASGWWWVEWVRTVPGKDPASPPMLILVELSRGSLVRDPMTMDAPYRPVQWLRIGRYSDDVVLTNWLSAPPTTASPLPSFDFWRLQRGPGGWWSSSLTYPVIVVTLPTLFLWYRRIRRRYRRGLCARCGYDLAGLAAVEARIVCPECGASNTAARIGKAALPRAARAVGEKPSPVARSAEPD